MNKNPSFELSFDLSTDLDKEFPSIHETEVKFLVDPSKFDFSYKDINSLSKIEQFYICKDDKSAVRVRIKNNNQAELTIKTKSVDIDNVCNNFEETIKIDMQQAKTLKFHKKGYDIIKTRLTLWKELAANDFYLFEIDFFEKENNGLIICEVEAKQKSNLPKVILGTSKESDYQKNLVINVLNINTVNGVSIPWITKNVSNDPRFSNAYLSQNPFSFWSDEQKS